MVSDDRATRASRTRPIARPIQPSTGLLPELARIFGRRRGLQSELIASLNEVADAVSSALSVADVLDVITDRAKRITDTDKAVLVLADEHGEHLDLETIIVRGRRGQHEQHWWELRLEHLADRVFETGESVVEVHRDERAILLCSPVLVRDRPVGLLCAINSVERPFTQDQVDFLAILAAFASGAIENARLAEQSRYVLLASERDRIAREMHDGVVQSLFSISLGLEVCKKQVIRDPASVAIRLDELQAHLNRSMTELRRFIYDLRPMKLAELGLVGALEFWVREITMGRPIKGRVNVHGETPRLTPSQEACLYRVSKEAVSNVVKHAGAENFEVGIDFRPGRVRIEIRDDGSGFDPDSVLERGADGMGLLSIKERMRQEGGTLFVDSTPGRGSVLCVDLPIEGIT